MFVDPLAENAPNWTPYRDGFNNSIMFTDPTGMSANPIYDPDGNFLGTDNKGLQGKAIVMNKENFTQGMSSEDAKSNDLGVTGFKSFGAASKASTHYNNLSKRSDYDGFVTLTEGVNWAKNNVGALDNPTPNNMLYLDTSKLDFGNISKNDFNKASGRATDYDWNYGDGIKRNSAMFIERSRTGLNDSHGFRAFYYGRGTLNPPQKPRAPAPRTIPIGPKW